MKEVYTACRICPRKCGVNRNESTGACRVGSTLQVSRAALHMWEEPCISGTKGSGTVFFSGCNLGCVYCQNQSISRGKAGKLISADRLLEIFYELEEKGANNINLVTGDHYLPTIAPVIERAKTEGFRLPFLLNTSSYIEVDTLKRMEGLIDIYLPDFKYIRDEDALRYSRAPGYPDVAKAAIAEMVRQQPECRFISECTGTDPVTEENVAEEKMGTDDTSVTQGKLLSRGVVVRHLLLPGMLIQAKLILRYLFETYGDQIYISLMSQYTPDHELLKEHFPEIDRKVTPHEYHSLIEYAAKLGVTRGFMQEGESADESFIPPFDNEGV